MAVALAEAGADVVGVYNTHVPETAKSAVEKTVSTFGRLDILVNDAGIIRRAPSLEFSEKDWDAVMNINLKYLFFLCQAAAR